MANSSSSNMSSERSSRPPDDTVLYSIYPDFSDSSSPSSELQSLHLSILKTISPLTASYIWQHQPFTLSISSSPVPHLHGHLRYGDNLEDEWFLVFLLFRISRAFPGLSIATRDSDGDFLLIETAFHLPRWITPEASANRVFIRNHQLCIIPEADFRRPPSLRDALAYLGTAPPDRYAAPAPAQDLLLAKLEQYPQRAFANIHTARARLPLNVARVLRDEPTLVSLAVEGFYDRDVDTMKFIAAGMERFLPSGSSEELVQVAVRMSRAMYAQLVQQTFQPPKSYPPLPARTDATAYMEAELGMKIACGFEMMYQSKKREGAESSGTTWEVFKQSMENNGYFQGLLPGSEEYKRLMKNVEGYYRLSSVHSRASEMLNAPVRRIEEILSLPHNPEVFKCQELPSSDGDLWMYDGEDELTAALQERQKEMELYNSKHKKKQKLKEQDVGPSKTKNLDDFNLEDVAQSMQAFVKKVSSYEGAEVPEDRNLKDVDFDVDRFMKDMESVLGRQTFEDADSDDDIEDELSSDMDFDAASEDESDIEDNEEGADDFTHAYYDVLNRELKDTTIGGSFVRANEKSLKKEEGTSNAQEDVDEFTPVDVDVNLVKSLLDSFSSQQGLPGPASNILGLMGLQLPPDSSKGK